MVDWATTTGQHIVQLLPINDTTGSKTWRDSYPYSAISVFALHPIYLGLKDFPLKDSKKQAAYLSEAKKLNDLKDVDYEKALHLKLKYCRDLFDQEAENILPSTAYRTFCKENESWLFPYCCYCYLRDKNNTTHFEDWGEFARYDKAQLKRVLKKDKIAKRETSFYSFMQYLLHCQLSKVKEYTHKKGVALKAISLSAFIATAWMYGQIPNCLIWTHKWVLHPTLFRYLDKIGVSTYNWSAMEKENYA